MLNVCIPHTQMHTHNGDYVRGDGVFTDPAVVIT